LIFGTNCQASLRNVYHSSQREVDAEPATRVSSSVTRPSREQAESRAPQAPAAGNPSPSITLFYAKALWLNYAGSRAETGKKLKPDISPPLQTLAMRMPWA